MFKRGLSDIIATVLIVLLALASVAIVWGFVSPTIRNAGENVDISSRCLETEFKVTQCNIAGSGPYQVTSTIQLIKGSAEKARVSYENQNGEIVTTEINNTEIPQEIYGSVVSGSLNFDSADFPLEARVAAIVLNSEGEEQLCQPISVATICDIGSGTTQNPPGQVCTPGSIQSCTVGGSPGTQTCNAQGTGYGACTVTLSCDGSGCGEYPTQQECQADSCDYVGEQGILCGWNFGSGTCEDCSLTTQCEDYLDSASCGADACGMGGCSWDVLSNTCEGGLAVEILCGDYTTQNECTTNGCNWNAASEPPCF